MNAQQQPCQRHARYQQRNAYSLSRTTSRVVGLIMLALCSSTNVFALVPTPNESDSWLGFTRITSSGYFKNETAYRIQEPRTYTKFRNIYYSQHAFKMGRSAEIKMAVRAYYDMVYDLFDYDTVAGRTERDDNQPLTYVEGLPENRDSNIFEFRETYLDLFEKDFDLRLGKQFIVWGILTGVRVIDEVNPMDFRELITPELLDYRVPLWSAKLNYYLGSHIIEGIAIPDLTFHQPAPPGSEWELFQEVPGTTYPSKRQLENWEFGLRWVGPVGDNEVSLSYFYTWDDFPVLARQAKITSFGLLKDPVFYPSFQRMHMFGNTLQREWGMFIFKSEVAYVRGKYFGLNNTVDRDGDGFLDHDGAIKRDHLRYGLGVDFSLFKSEFALSATQWAIFNYDSEIVMDQFDTAFNAFIMRPIPERNAVFELLAIYLLQLEELYIKPKLSFRPSNSLKITVGMDMFWGEKSQLGVIAVDGDINQLQVVTQNAQFIGNFNKNDRVFIEFKYSF